MENVKSDEEMSEGVGKGGMSPLSLTSTLYWDHRYDEFIYKIFSPQIVTNIPKVRDGGSI